VSRLIKPDRDKPRYLKQKKQQRIRIMKEKLVEALERIRRERQAMIPIIDKFGIACQESDDPVKMWNKNTHLIRTFNQFTIDEERILNKIRKKEQKKTKKKDRKLDTQLAASFDNLTIKKKEKSEKGKKKKKNKNKKLKK
jgi:hypothetical protein